MTEVSWIYFQIGRPAQAACSDLRVSKNFACLKTASLVFRLDLLPPRYLSADNDNEVRLHKHLHTPEVCQKRQISERKKIFQTNRNSHCRNRNTVLRDFAKTTLKKKSEFV